MAAVYRVKTAAHDPIPQAVRRVGDLELHIDRPRGTQKTWELPDGSVTRTYPVDYGFLPAHAGEDGEPLDFFVGSDPDRGWHGSFHKRRPRYQGTKRVGFEPDETKYFAGLTPEEHAEVLKMFDGPSSGLVTNHRFFASLPGLQGALARHRAKTAAHKTKTFCGHGFKIDRPKGFVKEWPGGKKFTYPVDYGYFPRYTGEDGEGLDAFVGDDPDGHFESFQKLKPHPEGEHREYVLDETKFLLGVTGAERKKIYDLYGPREVHARRVYKDMAEAMRAAEKFEGKDRFPKKADLRARLQEAFAAALDGRAPAISTPSHEEVALALVDPDSERKRNRALGGMAAARLFGKDASRANPYGRVDAASIQTDRDEEFDAAPDFWSRRA